MFIGHFAVAFAAKRAAPSVSLGTLFVACELVDVIWPVFVLAGIELVRIEPGITAFTPFDFVYYPWSHSLAMGVVWGFLLSLPYIFFKKNPYAAGVVALVVLSHWLLDFIAHRPDLPLVPGSEARFGLGLWNSIPGTLAVEGLMFVAALALYLKSTKAKDKAGSIGFWLLIAVLIASYLGAAFGPLPPNVEAVAWTGIAGGIMTAIWGYWLERHREVRTAS